MLDKFSLYYPDNSAISGDTWDLLQGYSFRTAALSGSLNRAGLHGLGAGSIPVAEGTDFDAAKHGLVIDADSAYEDCAYVDTRAGETSEDRESRIDGMVNGMVAAYGSQGILSYSYDPAEQQLGMTALESEWNLLKRVAAEDRAAAAPQPAPAPELELNPEPEPALVPQSKIGDSVWNPVQAHMSQHKTDLLASGCWTAAVEVHLQGHLERHLAKITPAEEAVPPDPLS